MSGETAEPVPPTGDVVAEVRAEAERRRSDGAYPDGLEDHLDRHYHHIVQADRGRRADAVRIHAEHLRAASQFHLPPIETASRVPGGSLVDRVVGQTVRRHLEALLGQLQAFGAAAAGLLDAEVEALAELRGHVDALNDRLGSESRAPDDVRDAVADLSRRVRELEQALAPGQRSAAG